MKDTITRNEPAKYRRFSLLSFFCGGMVDGSYYQYSDVQVIGATWHTNQYQVLFKNGDIKWVRAADVEFPDDIVRYEEERIE